MAKATRAALTLNDMEVTRQALRTDRPPPAPTGKEERERRGQTLRLEPEAWAQLKILAVEQRQPVHTLLIEAVNLLFDRYNKPTIAG